MKSRSLDLRLCGLVLLILAADKSFAQAGPTAPTPPQENARPKHWDLAEKLRSLMFSSGDYAALKGALGLASAPDHEVESASAATSVSQSPKIERLPDIRLSGLADFGDGSWVAWVNGIRVTPERQAAAFRIVAVTDGAAELMVVGDKPVRIRLQPHQTWRSATETIIEEGTQ